MSDDNYESDAVEQSQEVSSEPSESSSEVSQEAPQQLDQQPQSVPFHEDPKVQDYIQRQTERQLEQQRSYYDQQFQQMQQRLQQYENQSKAQQVPSQEDALIAELKRVNPEFGARFEAMEAAQAKLDQLEKWQSEQTQTQTYNQAMNEINRLHTEYGVPDELKRWYSSAIREIAGENPNMGLSDLPKVYKQVHEELSNTVNSIRRLERESYVNDKKPVAQSPTSQPKGQAVNPGKKPEWSKDPVQRRDQLIQRVRKLAAAEDEV